MPGVRYCLQCMTSSILPPSILTTSSSFLFIPPSATAFSTLSLHDALPISLTPSAHHDCRYGRLFGGRGLCLLRGLFGPRDRKSTRLNSSHVAISYADFFFKKNN